jgi:proline racemase
MTYPEMIQCLTERGEHSVTNLCQARKAALTAALMNQVSEAWRRAFITDSPVAVRYPELLSQALEETITPEELGRAIMDGAIDYAIARVERDLQRLQSDRA